MGKREKKIIKGNNLKPRLAVFRSNKHIYAQVIDDSCSKTIISCSTLEVEVKAKCEKTSNKLASKLAAVQFLARPSKRLGIRLRRKRRDPFSIWVCVCKAGNSVQGLIDWSSFSVTTLGVIASLIPAEVSTARIRAIATSKGRFWLGATGIGAFSGILS